MKKVLLSLFCLLAVVGVNAETVTDAVTPAIFGVPVEGGKTSYNTFTSQAQASGAVYNANICEAPAVGDDKESNVLQLRWDKSDAKKQAGIVSTVSGGYVKSVTVNWNGNTADARVLAVYGSNTAYTSYTDLQGEATCGTEIAQLKYADATNLVSTLEVTGEYKYIAFRSTSGALYLNSIDVVWDSEGGNQGGGDDPNPPTPGDGYESLAAWFAAKPAADAALDASLTAIYQDGQDLWVCENGTYALVYGTLSQTYKNGDRIPAPVSGQYKEYNGMPEFLPVASTFGAGTAGEAVAAQAVEISDLTVADAARYIRLEGVQISATDNALNFEATDGTATVTLRNRYTKTVTIPVTDDATVYGFVGVYNDAIQIYPVLIEAEDVPVGPSDSQATFNFNDPASLNPVQAMPGDGADNAVNLTDAVLTDGPVSISFYLPADLVGKSKDPRLYLYKGTPEFRAYSGTSMTVAASGDATITAIEFQVSYDDNINATVDTGTLTAGKPAYWNGNANSVTFNWTATSKMNKMIVTYTSNSGIESVETVDMTLPVEFFNLQGVRVENPANGIFIRRQGNNVSKILVK